MLDSMEDILSLIYSDSWALNILRLVQSREIPDCWVGGGFVRNRVWDEMHGFPHSVEFYDIDLMYFDPNVKEPETESSIERELKSTFSASWEATNQSRMHEKRRFDPFVSTAHALQHTSVDTASCIAIRMHNNKLGLLAPYGMDDLLNLRIRPIPDYRNRVSALQQRIIRKKWLKRWPKLQLFLTFNKTNYLSNVDRLLAGEMLSNVTEAEIETARRIRERMLSIEKAIIAASTDE